MTLKSAAPVEDDSVCVAVTPVTLKSEPFGTSVYGTVIVIVPVGEGSTRTAFPALTIS
jgi:hypothetical protein